jgi:hypothetical protein
VPITPATTGPALMPILGSRPGRPATAEVATTSRMSRRQERGPARVIRIGIRDAGGGHGAIADRLDLVEPVPLDERVEVGEVVSRMPTTSTGEALCERGEVHDVGEQDVEELRDRRSGKFRVRAKITNEPSEMAK